MNKDFHIISKKDLYDLFERLSAEYRVLVPYLKRSKPLAEEDRQYYFAEFKAEEQDELILGGIRQSAPVKSFLTHPREAVMPAEKIGRQVIIAGVKSCDLASLAIQDYVFKEGDTQDPFYVSRRENTFIISADCTYAKETCFCLAVDGAPYPSKDFDINLSALDGRFLAQTGSEKGSRLLERYNMFFKPASAEDLRSRESLRGIVSGQVRDFISKRGTPDITKIKGAVRKSYDLIALWEDSSSTCVECGACNLACPTCHCFLLFDEKSKTGVTRTRIWDSCLYKTFARVAGGANPRRHLYERLRNRFDKKFEFFPEVINKFACTGCGRCIDACPGNIDIREVLKGAVTGKWEKPPHE